MKPAKFNIEKILADHPPRTNFNVIQLDGKYNVRIATVTGRFPWHHHINGDEGWLVWKGKLQIDVEGSEKIILDAGEGAMIPCGVKHSPLCLEEGTIVVVFNVNNFQHKFVEKDPDLGGFSEHSSY
ncbi:MAG TPA: cupin domain-containing protein [Tepidisphaeraceae bacterium]|nr:cupin domain-containing protein [Tepidisphaeraceae bacterium]